MDQGTSSASTTALNLPEIVETILAFLTTPTQRDLHDARYYFAKHQPQTLPIGDMAMELAARHLYRSTIHVCRLWHTLITSSARIEKAMLSSCIEETDDVPRRAV